MKEAIQFLTGLFYPEWCPPNVPGRRHSLLDDSKSPRHEPVQARTKIMAVLGRYEWKTIDQIAKETSLMTNTVAITTDRMYKARRIERKKQDTLYGKINMYRKK
jgi:hypothetical protein